MLPALHHLQQGRCEADEPAANLPGELQTPMSVKVTNLVDNSLIDQACDGENRPAHGRSGVTFARGWHVHCSKAGSVAGARAGAAIEIR